MDQKILKELKQLTRESLALSWRKHEAGLPLKDEERHLVASMENHPEWLHLWRSLPEFDGEIVTSDGVNPLAAIAVEATVRGLISKGGDRWAYQTYRHLCREGLTDAEARSEIGRVFLGIYWEMGHGMIEPGGFSTRFHEVLKLIIGGQSASNIWPQKE